jgi:hypothetical protein
MISTTTDLEAARTGLLAWYADLIGVDVSRVRWEDEPQIAADDLVGTIKPVAERELGRTETQVERDPGTPAAGEELLRSIGQPVALSLSLVLDGYDQRLHRGTFFPLSSARTKIRGGPSLAALRDGARDRGEHPEPRFAFAIIRTTGPFNVARDDAGRRYPRAVLDVELGYTRVESLSPLSFIESAEITSHLRDVDGTELPSPPNVTEQQIPEPDPGP